MALHGTLSRTRAHLCELAISVKIRDIIFTHILMSLTPPQLNVFILMIWGGDSRINSQCLCARVLKGRKHCGMDMVTHTHARCGGLWVFVWCFGGEMLSVCVSVCDTPERVYYSRSSYAFAVSAYMQHATYVRLPVYTCCTPYAACARVLMCCKRR